MKKKLATLLRRWAFKLSPAGFITPELPEAPQQKKKPVALEIKKFKAARHLTRQEIDTRIREGDGPDDVTMNLDHMKEIINELGWELYRRGAITFHNEPEGCCDSQPVLIGTVYAATRPPKPKTYY